MSFEIMEHIDKLTPAKESGRYICPGCGGNNFTIGKSGAFKCWSDCEAAAIRESLSPWNEKHQERKTNRVIPRQPKSKAPTPAALPDHLTLTKLLDPASDCPQPQTRFDQQLGETQETVYHYGADKWKVRVQWSDATKVKGYSKKFVLWHRGADGAAIPKTGEGTRPPYQIDELLEAAKTSSANAALCGEGEGVVEAYRRLGLACTTLSGFSKDELTLLAQTFKNAGLTLVYHRDNDTAGTSKSLKVQEACDRVGVPYLAIDPTRICPDLRESGDVVDILLTMPEPEFLERLQTEVKRALLEKILLQTAHIEDIKPQRSSNGGSGDGEDVLEQIAAHFKGRLRLNRFTGEVELDGVPVRLEEHYIELRLQLGLKANKQVVIDLMMYLARQQEYSPVAEYLEGVSQRYRATTVSLLDDMATRYFGTTEPVFNLYVKRFLIGAAARALNPGCKQDTALILQGKQGLGKSTFFSTLAGEWFDDSLGDASNKDERLKLRAHWILEWAELERAFSKRSTGDVKSFLSCSTDNLRVPYGRNVESFPRHCAFAGTTNEQEFLADVTGDRRFWVLPVQKNIDWKLLAQERDQIWAAAVALYRNGERWWFEGNEQDLSQQLNKPFHTEDPWATYIRDYIEGLTEVGGAVRVYVRDILEHCLQIEKSRQDKGSQMRVAAILKRLGFTKKPDSRGQPCWSKVLSPPPAPQTPSDTSKNEVSVPSNNHTATVSDTVLTPTDTCSKHLQKNVESPIAESEPPTNTAFVVEDLVPEVAVGVSNQDTATVSSTDTSTDTPTPPAASDSLGVGDYVSDKSGAVAVITALAKGGWLICTGDYVSRTDIRERRFTKVSPPTEVAVEQSEAVSPSDDWNTSENLEALAEWLDICDSPAMLAEVRAAYPHPEALKTACKRLDAVKAQQIKQWVLELNKIVKQI